MPMPGWGAPAPGMMPGVQKPFAPAYQPPPTIAGRWVNSFQEVQAAPVLADGSTMIFMLTNEPVLYLVSLNNNGQKVINGFKISPLTGEAENATPAAPPMTMEDRMAKIEAALSGIMPVMEQIKPLLVEENTNESNTSSPAK